MWLLVALLAISRLCESGLPYHGVTVGITPFSAPVSSQYHAQDVYGQYSYGYSDLNSAKDEVKTADGVTRGGYSYIDANGILQSVQYISDPVNGFRVAATNIPQDLPEVAYAKAQHYAAYEQIRAEHALLDAEHAGAVALSPIPYHGGLIVPVRTEAAPAYVQQAIAYTPVATSSQYHAQDGHGQYSYGYTDPLSSKSEAKSADGVTRGGYSYIDANGIYQQVSYVSDPVNGFRVQATNLPEAPAVELIGPKVTTTVVGPADTNTAVVAAAPAVEPIVPVLGAVQPIVNVGSYVPAQPVVHEQVIAQPIAQVHAQPIQQVYAQQIQPVAPVEVHAQQFQPVAPVQQVYAQQIQPVAPVYAQAVAPVQQAYAQPFVPAHGPVEAVAQVQQLTHGPAALPIPYTQGPVPGPIAYNPEHAALPNPLVAGQDALSQNPIVVYPDARDISRHHEQVAYQANSHGASYVGANHGPINHGAYHAAAHVGPNHGPINRDAYRGAYQGYGAGPIVVDESYGRPEAPNARDGQVEWKAPADQLQVQNHAQGYPQPVGQQIYYTQQTKY